MDFSEKILKILETNKLGIATAEALSEFCGFNRDTIRKAIDRGSQLNRANTRILLDKMRINPEWWESGKGEIYLQKGTYVELPTKKDPGDEHRILTQTIDRMGQTNEFLLDLLKRYKERFGDL